MPKTGFLFSGQGAQRSGMGKSFYESFPSAAALYDRANEILGWDLKQISFEGPDEKLTETSICQPALFVHGMAIAAVLQEKGLIREPKTALGLSLGEVTALTAAGVFDFEQGLRVVAERGRLMQEACETTDGSMASVIGVDRKDVETLCEEFEVEIANLNCPGQIVISGESEKISAAVEAGKKRGFKRVIPLKVAGAYHSRLMEPARAAFSDFLQTISFQKPRIKVFSNTTGKEVGEPDEIREALVEQVVSSVLWEDCQRNAAAAGIDFFVECGPGAVLSGLARRIDPGIKTVSVSEADDLEKVALLLN